MGAPRWYSKLKANNDVVKKRTAFLLSVGVIAPSRHKTCNLRSALHQTRKQRIHISKRRLLQKPVKAVWHSACLLCLPLVCAWCPLYEFCSLPMRQTRPQSMYKGHLFHNATPRLPFFSGASTEISSPRAFPGNCTTVFLAIPRKLIPQHLFRR